MTAASPLLGQAEAPAGRAVAQVLLDSQLPHLDHLFDYAVPEDLAADLRVGQRVRVPFRSQQRRSQGYVVGFADRSEFPGELQPIAEIVGRVPVLAPEIYRLARAVADRAGGSAFDILRLAIPPRVVRAETRHLASPAADAGAQPVDPPLSEAERELGARLCDGDRLSVIADHGPVRLATGEWVGGWALPLARAALAVCAAGRSAIVVVPDYRDLDQVRDTFAALGARHVVRVDARQAAGERYASFLRALEPQPCIVLGNRSAVYAPAHRLGAIFMWDDGDPLHAEPLAPYVHARDAALVRAEQSGAGLWFGGHVRSAEVQRLVDLGYVRSSTHPPRRTRVIAAEHLRERDPRPERLPELATRTLREGLRGGPVLVQVATPGYAPIAVCGRCGDLGRCRVCRGPLGSRSATGHASCRWCGELATSWRCETCGGSTLRVVGAGSARTAEQFEAQFPGVRVVLSDGEHPVERVDSRPALVVATRGAEPLAAAGYRAVVLLDADRLLNLPTLRAGEDCLRWWSNAAALAAPDATCVVASGGGPVVRAFTTGRLHEWLRSELQDRQVLRYPPAVRVASVAGGTAEVDRALATLDDLAGVDVLGPASIAEGLVRAIVRFDYASGAEVARRLRGALVADAAGGRSRVAGRRPGRAPREALRLRFDDRGVFDA